jgi:ankyrin repeat protein
MNDDNGFTPLHYAAWLGKEEETLKLLKSGSKKINL